MSQVYAKLSAYTRKNGERAIVIYSAESLDRSSPGIGYHVHPDDFDEETGFVKDTHKDHKNINSVIRKKVGEAESARLTSIAAGKKFRPGAAKASAITLYDYCLKITAEANIAAGTRRNRDTQLKKIKEYDPGIRLRDVTAEWMVGYKKAVEKGQKGPSAFFATYQFLIKIFEKARKAKLNTEEVFDLIDIPKQPTTDKRKYLNQVELAAFEEFTFSGLDRSRYTAGLWQMFASYSGLRYSDWSLSELPRYLKEGKIEMHQTKTTGHVIIPLYPKLTSLIKLLIENDKYKFTDVYHNRIIKKFGAGEPINPKISSHWGRHTFGTFLADNDVPPQVAQKLLGHKSILMTMKYYKVTPKKVAETVAKLLGQTV